MSIGIAFTVAALSFVVALVAVRLIGSLSDSGDLNQVLAAGPYLI